MQTNPYISEKPIVFISLGHLRTALIAVVALFCTGVGVNSVTGNMRSLATASGDKLNAPKSDVQLISSRCLANGQSESFCKCLSSKLSNAMSELELRRLVNGTGTQSTQYAQTVANATHFCQVNIEITYNFSQIG